MAAEAQALAPGGQARPRPRRAAGRWTLDGVVIATPSALHAEQAIAALERGVAVFCQKPLGAHARPRRAAWWTAARAADRLLGGRPLLPLHRGHAAASASWSRAGELGRGLRGRPRLPQRLRTGQAVVLRPGALRRRLRHGPGRPPGRPRALDAGLPGGAARLQRSSSPAASGSATRRRRVEDYAAATLDLDERRRRAARLLVAACRPGATRDRGRASTAPQGGAAMRNVDGSFYDFVAERFRGTARERWPPRRTTGAAAPRWIGHAPARGGAIRLDGGSPCGSGAWGWTRFTENRIDICLRPPARQLPYANGRA